MAHTPKRHGHLARQWERTPVERVATERGVGYSAGTRNPDYRARFVNYGVSPHKIRPKNREAIETPEGARAEADHPGHGGAFMVEKAAAELEAALPAVAQPFLSAWAAEIERGVVPRL